MQAPNIIGRDRLLSALTEAMDERSHRIVTLHGPGGVGKTTVGRILANEREIEFIELAACRTVEDIASVVGSSLDLPEAATSVEAVGEALRDRDWVVLDNAEQVTTALREAIDRWLRMTGARFVVTSREPLGAQDEFVLEVEPLPRADAVELFRTRARSSAPQFEIDDSNREDVTALLDLLDGLPLAIELAASRMRIVTPAQLCERLSERFDVLRNRGAIDRHATLDACVEWSWELLDDGLRQTLTELSVFRGRFRLEECEEVIVSSGWVGDDLDELTRRSLLWVEEGDDGMWFSLYDSVRRFLDRTREVDAAVVRRFGEFLLEQVESGVLERQALLNVVHAFELCLEAYPELAIELIIGARQRLWRAGFIERLFVMLRRAAEIDDLDPVYRGAVFASLASCHYAAMDYAPTIRALDRADELVGDADSDLAVRVRSHAKMLRAVRADEEHDFERAEPLYEDARSGLDRLPFEQQAHLLAAAALASLRRDRVHEAVADFEASIAAARRSPDRALLARTLSWSANAYLVSQQMEQAQSRLAEALEIYEQRDDVVSRAVAEYGMAQTLVHTDPGRARVFARQAQQTARIGKLRVLEATTDALVARLEPSVESARALRRALRVFPADSSHNDRWSVWLSLIIVLVHNGDLDLAVQEAEFLVTAARRLASERELKSVSRYLGAVLAMRGELEDAAEVLQDDPEFMAALERSLAKGRVSEEDIAEFDDGYMRYVHDQSPLHLELLDQFLSEHESRVELRLKDGGKSVVLPNGEEVEMDSRFVLKRLLMAMCEYQETNPGESMTMDMLVESGWPDETMTYESGMRRVYSAIRNIRKLGFEDIVLTGEDGYLLDPSVVIIRD